MMLAAMVLATVCVPVTPPPAAFFDASRSVFFARATSEYEFTVERVVRGPARIGERFFVMPSPCARPVPGTLHLVSWQCPAEEECAARWVREDEAAPMLAVLPHLHAETHQTMLAKALAWRNGRLSFEKFQRWITTATAKPWTRQDDLFTHDLLAALQDLVIVMEQLQDRSIVEEDLRAFAKLARAFPRGGADAFDDAVEASGATDVRFHDEYVADLLEPLERARKKAEAALPE